MNFLNGLFERIGGIFAKDNDELLFFIVIFLILFSAGTSENFFNNAEGSDDNSMLFFVVLFLILFLNNGFLVGRENPDSQ